MLKLGRLLRDARGVSAVEFALMAPIVLAVVAELANFSVRIVMTREVNSAAEAGAHYASKSGYDAGAISNVINGYTSTLPISASPSPQLVCGCPGSGASLSTVTCGSTCSDGSSAGQYVVASATMNFSDRFAIYPTGPSQIKAASWVRVK